MPDMPQAPLGQMPPENQPTPGGADGMQAATQLAQRGGSQGSLLQLILTFLAGAGVRDLIGSAKQLKNMMGQGGARTPQQKGKQPTGPAAPPQMAASQGQPGQPSPQQLQQILAMLAAKGGQ